VVISLGLIFVFNAGILLTPSQAACKAALPAVTDGLGLKMKGPTAPEHKANYLLCFLVWNCCSVLYPTPQPSITKLFVGKKSCALSSPK